MRKTFNFFYAFLLALLGFGVTLIAEEITLTTYYPAPYGAYDELTVSGNVGIGTTAPTVGDLQIGTHGDGLERSIEFPENHSRIVAELPWTTSIESMGNVRVNINTDDVPDDWFMITHGSAHNMIVWVKGASGNFGIGVEPAYKLDVAGDINTTGDVRKNGTAYSNPDYVFEPGYKFMNITETKNFVFENKHLPNMPSSEEIKADGVKIFEQNRLLLEKLEEAYLHIFQLEERITKLERR